MADCVTSSHHPILHLPLFPRQLRDSDGVNSIQVGMKISNFRPTFRYLKRYDRPTLRCSWDINRKSYIILISINVFCIALMFLSIMCFALFCIITVTMVFYSNLCFIVNLMPFTVSGQPFRTMFYVSMVCSLSVSLPYLVNKVIHYHLLSLSNRFTALECLNGHLCG